MADRYKEYVRELVFQMADIILAAINAKWIHPSLALRLLKANMGDLEERCEILEFALRQPLKEKTDPLLAARPRIIGLSVSIWNHSATAELLKALEEKWKNGRPEAGQKPIVVLGGPEVSWLPGEAEIFSHADYVIRGEGENAFRELCVRLLKAEDGRPAPEKFIKGNEADLHVIDPGVRLYTDEDIKRKLVYVESSRGCPFGCEFCLSSRDQKVRYFPLEPFFAYIDTLIEKGAATFKFLDRTFNLDTDRAKKILDFFLERIGAAKTRGAEKSRPFCVHFEMVPSRFPPELKEALRRFPPGTLRIELGIQTFNAETASLIHRPGNSGEELQNLRFLRRETNAVIHADLIAGLPGETFASFGTGFDRLWQVLSGNAYEKTEARPGEPGAPFEIQLGTLKCLPGTPIVRHNRACGMRYTPDPPYEVIETGTLPAPELQRIKNFARFWEIIVNRNPFPGLMPRILPPGEAAFDKFMELSDRLLLHFGRNWGIDRKDLRSFLET